MVDRAGAGAAVAELPAELVDRKAAERELVEIVGRGHGVALLIARNLAPAVIDDPAAVGHREHVSTIGWRLSAQRLLVRLEPVLEVEYGARGIVDDDRRGIADAPLRRCR